MKIAVYAGSFDPITNGHVDIINRAVEMFDKLYILVTENIGKKATFTPQERMEMIKKLYGCHVEVHHTDDLVVKFAREHGATKMVRGLRNIRDFEAEIALYHFNRNLDPNIETIYLMPSHRHTYVSSTAIKELVFYGADISKYVPAELEEDIVNGIRKSFKKV